jgi:hypothetical protein
MQRQCLPGVRRTSEGRLAQCTSDKSQSRKPRMANSKGRMGCCLTGSGALCIRCTDTSTRVLRRLVLCLLSSP